MIYDNNLQKIKDLFNKGYELCINDNDIKSFLANLGYEKVDTYTTDHIYAYQNLSFSL